MLAAVGDLAGVQRDLDAGAAELRTADSPANPPPTIAHAGPSIIAVPHLDSRPA
jgi:hypothetical protein